MPWCIISIYCMHLNVLYYRNNFTMPQTGTIPASTVGALASYESVLDLRVNFLSCCGRGFVTDDTYTHVR